MNSASPGTNSPDQPAPWRALLLWVILAGLMAAAGVRVYFQTPTLESGDSAVNALQIENAKHLHELYGNYSRFEFNHPGPAFFYVYAAGELVFHDWLHLSPSPANAHLLACMLLQAAFFSLAVMTLARHFGPRAFVPLALAAAAGYFGTLPNAFVSIWPPHVLLMPFLCFLAATVSFASGRRVSLPLMVVAGGFLFHGHVAQPLFVAGLGLLAAALHMWNTEASFAPPAWRRFASAARRPLLVSAGITGLFLLPVLIDVVLLGGKSNVWTIIGRFRFNTGESKTLLQSALYFLSFATRSEDQETLFTTLGPGTWEFFRKNALWFAGWAALIAAVLLLARAWRDRLDESARRFLRTAGFVWVACVGLCALWGIAQAGPMFQFNGYFYYAVYFFPLLVLLGLVSFRIGAHWPVAVGAVLCVGAATLFLWKFNPPEGETDMSVSVAMDAVLRASPGHAPKLLVFEHTHWPTVVSMALELKRRGYDYRVMPWWGFMFGYDHLLTRERDQPEAHADVWWITRPGEGGIPLTDDLNVFTTPARLDPNGTVISFHGQENGFRYLVSGLSVGNIEYAFTELRRLVLAFQPQPAARDVRLVFDGMAAEKGKTSPAQPGEVYFNGTLVGTVALGPQRMEAGVTIPRELWNRDPRALVEIRLPESTYHSNYVRPRHSRWMGWALWKIRVEPAP